MDPNIEGNEPVQAVEQEPTDLELIQSAKVTSEPAPEPVKEPEPEPEPTSTVDPKEEELQRLKRIIALDPQKSAIYEQEKYGIQPVQSQPQAKEAPKQLTLEEEFAQTFPGEEFDPFNLKHSAFIQQYNLRPAFSYIEQTQQQEAEYQQRQQQEQNAKQVEELNKGVQELFAKDIPIITELLGAESLTFDQQLLIDAMERGFQKELMRMFPPRQDGKHIQLWANPEVHKEVVANIMPSVRQTAQKLGLFEAPKPKPPVNQAMAREAYVEPSNAVPATTGNPFDEALKKDDIAGAFAAIRRM